MNASMRVGNLVSRTVRQWLRGWPERRGALHARRPALSRDHKSHLPGGLVDHLVAEHDRSAGAARFGEPPLVSVQDQLRMIVILLRRREDLVGRGDLVWMQH